ncbi:MAG: hypothetical protein Q8P27_01310, partial [Candidatus Peregrinibacteria bacterium]|nr:hypothetical protein [Candidatus Peregrinibacteria bacterium]
MEKQTLKPVHQKILSSILLGVFWLMSFILNNLSSFWEPNGKDEYAYFGTARRMVIFENKVPSIEPFQGGALLYSYWLGLLHDLTNVPLEILTRFF